VSPTKFARTAPAPRTVDGEGKVVSCDERVLVRHGWAAGRLSAHLVFDLDGHRIGCLPWDDNEVVDLDGHYFGTIVDDRLVRRNDWCERPCMTLPDDPGPVERTGQPSAPHYFPNRFAYQDVKIHHHA
jgi:hypothetical protein